MRDKPATYAIEFVLPRMILRSRLSPAQYSLTMVCKIISIRHSYVLPGNGRINSQGTLGRSLAQSLWKDNVSILTRAPRGSFLCTLGRHIPGKVIRRPFESERHTIPDSKVHCREETNNKREVHNRRPDLECVTCPPIAQGGHKCDGVHDGRICVDLGNRVSEVPNVSRNTSQLSTARTYRPRLLSHRFIYDPIFSLQMKKL